VHTELEKVTVGTTFRTKQKSRCGKLETQLPFLTELFKVHFVVANGAKGLSGK